MNDIFKRLMQIIYIKDGYGLIAFAVVVSNLSNGLDRGFVKPV